MGVDHPGAVAATLLWLLVRSCSRSTSNFTDYEGSYGTVGGVIVVLLWFYVSGIAILTGAEFNAESNTHPRMERRQGRKTRTGHSDRRPRGTSVSRATGVDDMKTELARFYGLIDEIKVAMMTTRRPDGHLVSRAMATQKRARRRPLVCHLRGQRQIRELVHDAHVNLAYYRPDSYEWVSVSGIATGVARPGQDQGLFEKDWKVWFGEEGDPRHGTPDDPRMVLIGVDVHTAIFLEVNKPKPLILFELAKGWFTGERVEAGARHQLRRAASVKTDDKAKRTRVIDHGAGASPCCTHTAARLPPASPTPVVSCSRVAPANMSQRDRCGREGYRRAERAA